MTRIDPEQRQVELARGTEPAVAGNGRMLVDGTLRSVSHPEVYARQCISLGRRDGRIQVVNPDDSPREKVLTGRLAAQYKEAVVRGAAYAPRRPALIEAVTLLAV